MKRLALIFVLMCGTGSASSGFSFKQFIGLKSSYAFSITGKRHISKLQGHGSVGLLTDKKIIVDFDATYRGQSLQARLTMTYRGQSSNSHLIHFQYEDNLGLGTSKINETVKADGWMVSQGLLTFAYNRSQNYFQMKIDKKTSENIVVLSWGTCVLKPVF